MKKLIALLVIVLAAASSGKACELDRVAHHNAELSALESAYRISVRKCNRDDTCHDAAFRAYQDARVNVITHL